MLNLVLTLISIAMFVMALTYGINYVNIKETVTENSVIKIKTDIQKVSLMVSNYRTFEESIPMGFDDLVSSGYMKQTKDSKGSIQYLPKISVEGFEWPESEQIRFINDELFVCFGGDKIDVVGKNVADKLNTTNAKVFDSETSTHKNSPQDNSNVVVSNICFDTIDKVVPKDGITGMYNIWVTVKATGESL